MADIDEIKNLDHTLRDMVTILQNLQTELKGVKSSMQAAFNPNLVSEFSNAVRGLKIGSLIDAEKSKADIMEIEKQIQILTQEKKHGKAFTLFTDEEYDKVRGHLAEIRAQIAGLTKKKSLSSDEAAALERLRIERDSFYKKTRMGGFLGENLSKEQINEVINALAKLRDIKSAIDLGDQKRAAQLANLHKLESDKTASVAAKEKNDAQKQIVEALKQQLQIQKQIEQLKQAPQQTAAVQQQIQALTNQYNALGQQIQTVANGNQEIINQAQAQVASQKQHQQNLQNTANALRDAKEQEKAYNDGIKQMERDETATRNTIIGLMKQQLQIEEQLNRLQNAPLTQATQGQIQNLTAQYNALGQQIQTVANGNQQLVQSAQQAVSAQAQAQQNTQQTTNAINAARQQQQRQAQAAKRRAAIERKADSESLSNQKRQIQIKSQLSAIDKNRITITKLSSNREKALAAQQQADYKSLQSELTKLIARQKELNTVSQGSGRRAKDRLSSYTISESEKAMRRYADAVRNAHREQRKLGDETSKMLPTIQRLASAFGVAFSVQGLVNFGKKLVETRGKFEMQFVAMKQIIGDVDAATKIWNQTMQQALQSPFKAMQLVDYTKKLAAYRIETDKLFDTTKRLADVSAGLGVDMGRLILAYGQVKSANFLRASEVRQFTEAGVNIYGELSKYLSEINGRLISTAEVAEMVQKRMVSFADVEEIFKRMTDEGGVFFNMQEVQADTVKGQINKLHDAYDQMLNTIGQANQGAIRDLIDTLNKLVRNWRDVAYIIKANAIALLPYIAATKVATLGMKNAGDAALWFSKKLVGKKVALSSTDKLLKLNAATLNFWQKSIIRATKGVQAFALGLKSIGRAFLPFAILEGIIFLFEKIGETARAKKQLEEDLSNIRIENSTKANNEIRNYDKLVKKFNELNQGSLERQEVISKLNSQYGKYIGFQVTETTTLNQLAEAQERVNKSIWENARVRAEEEQAQRIEQDFLSREQKLLKADRFTGNTMLSYRDERGVYQYLNPQEAKQFSEYVKVQMPSLTSEVLDNADAMQDATKKWLEAFFGVSVKDLGSTEYSYTIELINLYVEEEKRLREEQEKLSAEFSGMNAESLSKLTRLNSDISTAIATLTKSKIGEEVDVESLGLKIKVPTDFGEKTGVWEAIKEEINRRKDDFVIDLKFSNNLISEEQKNKLKDHAKTTGDLFVDTVNKEIADNILKSAGIDKSLDELKRDIIDNPEQIQDWDVVNHALELTNTHLIKSSDIVNGISTYTKMLAGNLEVGRTAIDDAVRAQGLLVNGTEEEVKKAQEAVDKARERYKWLLRIAKLIGLETKAADEIVAEEGYDLSVGDFRKQNAILAFQAKFGKATNDYGKQLSNIGVTENLKSVADAYHKQDEELQELIKNQEKALENETNLNEAQKADARQNIENLKVEQQMAEFLANYFGYVAKQKNTRSQKESVSSMLSLLKEMNSEYEKLSKSAYGYAKSQKTVSESYRSAFMEIYKGLGMKKGQGMILNFETTDFTTKSGLASAYQTLLDYVSDPKRVGKYAKDAVAQIEKALSQIKAEIDMDVSVRIREDFGRQMEEAFGNYELTLELQKLNLPADVAKDLFGFDYNSLNDLLERTKKFRRDLENVIVGKDEEGNDIIENHFDEDDEKVYLNWMKKVEDKLFQMRKERAKEYTKYLEQELSERAKLEMQYVKDTSFVKVNFKDQEQKTAILDNLKKDYEQSLKELQWKSFKESDFYVEMMQDLTSMPSEYLDLMMQKLDEWVKKADVLSPRALKEVLKAREQVMEAQVSLSPVRALGQSMGVIRGFQNETGRTDENGNQIIISKNIGEARKQLQGLITERQKHILELQEELDLEEAKLGKIKAQEEIQSTLNELTTKGVGGLKMTADAGVDITNIDKQIEYQRNLLAAITEDGDLTQNEGETDEAFARRQRQYEDEKKEIEAIIELLKRLREQREQAGAAGVDPTANLSASKMGTIANINKLKKEISDAEKEQARDQGIMSTGFAAWNKSVHGLFQNISSITGKVKDLGNQLYDTLEVVGVETDEVTDAWKDFGNSITDVILSALEMIPTLVTGFTSAGVAINASMGIIGLIAEAIQLVLVLISGLSKIHDAKYEKEIQNQQDKIDDLKDAYERLEKAIEKTWTTMSYIDTYNQQVENIKQQIAALEAQQRAEEAKKNTDENAVRQYQSDIQDCYDQLDELDQKQIEVFGGIGEEGYRSAAEGFVEAWKDAFLETGDGLQGLQDHFDEFLQDWFVKQATMRVAGKMLEPLFSQIDDAVDQYGVGGTDVLMSELANIREQFAIIAPELSAALEELAGMWDLTGDGGLSGLAAGIQGMTEEQANVLEAYWNSVRMYTASIDQNVAMIASVLGAGGNSPSSNPMLQQMSLIAANTQATHQLLQSVTKSGHSMGGYGIKVFNN